MAQKWHKNGTKKGKINSKNKHQVINLKSLNFKSLNPEI